MGPKKPIRPDRAQEDRPGVDSDRPSTEERAANTLHEQICATHTLVNEMCLQPVGLRGIMRGIHVVGLHERVADVAHTSRTQPRTVPCICEPWTKGTSLQSKTPNDVESRQEFAFASHRSPAATPATAMRTAQPHQLHPDPVVRARFVPCVS